jgi:NAD(P)-dependent dehydrogenase (short-subunit alcohol dehydrogenase family)
VNDRISPERAGSPAVGSAVSPDRAGAPAVSSERPLAGRSALVTGSSRGIGAETARLLAGLGAAVVVNYRDKARRADAVVTEIEAAGGSALAVRADLTEPAEVRAMFKEAGARFGGLDLLVLNASGGMERDADPGYALRLNRDAQLDALDSALPLMAAGSRVVFVTSHQAHFVEHRPTMPEYLPVARSKRAGEDALRARIGELSERGVDLVVVSGDMIEGTITATLLNRANPGAIEERRALGGGLPTVAEFAAAVAEQAAAAAPEEALPGRTVFIGGADYAELIGAAEKSMGTAG